MALLKKALAIILLLSMLLLSSCASAKPINSSEDDLRVVGKVGEYEVLYEELRFLVLTYKKTMIETYGENFFEDPKNIEDAKQYIFEAIKYNYAILQMCREVRIERDEPVILDAVQAKVEETVKELGSRKKYKRYLEENYMTDNLFRFNLSVDILQNELMYVYTNDLRIIETDYDAVYDIIKEEFIRTQHIYISKSNGKSDTDNKATIEKAYSELLGGADFMSLADKYGEDTELKDEGFYILEGYMSEKYENSAFSLGVGEFSDIIEDEGGFYIIKRLEQDSLYIMMNFETLAERYKNYTFIEMINDTQEALPFIPNEYLNSIDIFAIE